ncbi:Glycosyltransferase involved in cell wall bisynthesis [Lachnospiraceae bacterium C10]|nr:Glycosyltransferase involved in cell wall bisynthesis [Lachnospiraceae bacterium C10]
MISVCIPTYNGEKYIKEQLDSILCQIGDNDEIVISDDSSTDSTVAIINEYNDKRIHLYTNNHYKSPIYNMENALYHANGEYIFLADQDDIWMGNKVEVMLGYLDKYDCVTSDAIIVDSNLNVICPSFFEIRKCRTGILRNIIKNSYMGCCMAFRSSLKDKVLPFPKKLPMHDQWIGLNAEKYGKSIFIPEKLIEYRRHGDNASATGGGSPYSALEKIYFRIMISRSLILKRK